MFAIVTRHRWIQLYYRGAHRRPPTYGFAARHAFTAWLTVAMVAIATSAMVAAMAPAHAATRPMIPATRCMRVASNVSVCVTGRAPRLFELQCETPPHLPMRCEYRQTDR